jgi:hypothetical protein
VERSSEGGAAAIEFQADHGRGSANAVGQLCLRAEEADGPAPQRVDWIVLKGLENDSTQRYKTAYGFAADVPRYLSGEAVQAHPPSTAFRLKVVRRNERQVIAASLSCSPYRLGGPERRGVIEAKQSAAAQWIVKQDAQEKLAVAAPKEGAACVAEERQRGSPRRSVRSCGTTS